MKDIIKPTASEAVAINGFIAKPGTIEDVPTFVLIEDQAIAAREGKAIPDQLTSDHEVVRLRNEIQKPTSWSRGVYDGDKMVGFIFCYPGKDPDTGEIVDGREHISLLMVHPDYWGRGIASGLLDWSFDEAQRRGAKEISLWTETDNMRSRPLYERKGFILTGKKRICPDPLRPDPQVHYLRHF